MLVWNEMDMTNVTCLSEKFENPQQKESGVPSKPLQLATWQQALARQNRVAKKTNKQKKQYAVCIGFACEWRWQKCNRPTGEGWVQLRKFLLSVSISRHCLFTHTSQELNCLFASVERPLSSQGFSLLTGTWLFFGCSESSLTLPLHIHKQLCWWGWCYL